MPVPSLRSQFIRHIRKHFPYIVGQRVLLAVSGGLDSMALLHLFLDTRSELGVTPIVAHIDHHLRKDSGRDAHFVDNFCQKHHVECSLEEIPRAFWKEKKGNIEDVARHERYRLLEQIARRRRLPYILTAHHRDDQAETVLMRILGRGSGLRGLAGIAAVSDRGKFRYIRPLLPFSRRELALFMSEKKWVEDKTNADTVLRRNFFRHKVLPFLEDAVGGDVVDHIIQLSDIASHHEIVLSAALDFFWEAHRASPRSFRYLFSRKEISSYPDNFWAAAIVHLVRRYRGYAFGARTVKDIVGFLRGPAKKADYAQVTIRKDGDKTVFVVSAER